MASEFATQFDDFYYDSVASGTAADVTLTFFNQTEASTNKQTTNMQVAGKFADRDFIIQEIIAYPETDTVFADMVKMYDKAVLEVKISNNRVLVAPLVMFAPKNYISSVFSTLNQTTTATFAGVKSDNGFRLLRDIVIPQGAPFKVEVTVGHQAIGTASDIKVVLKGISRIGGGASPFNPQGSRDYIYYDTNDLGTTNNVDIEFFNGTESADGVQVTNMELANELPKNETFTINEVHTLFLTDMVTNDAAEVLEEGLIEFLVNNNRIWIIPALLCGSEFKYANAIEDLADSAVDAIGTPSGGQLRFNMPFVLRGGVPFKFRFRTGTTAAGSGDGAIIAIRGIRTVL